MHKFSLFLGLVASVAPSFAAVTTPSVKVYKSDGPVNEGSYIVKFYDGVDKAGALNLIQSLSGGTNKVSHDWDPEFFNGVAGNFDDNVISALMSNSDVEYIADDGIVSTSDVQTDASWNLARVSTRAKLTNQDPFALTFKYGYNPNPGKGVDIYVVDTGIYVKHPDFEDRARWGGTFCLPCLDLDGNGHGTHVAGTAGGKRSGIAKTANLIAVKVLDDTGSGTNSGVISGLDYVYREHMKSGRPSIATMSLGGSNSTSLNDAVRKLIKAGVHCTVAAGNSNEDAKNTSPANTDEAITVGATDISDTRAFYSNFGPVVDVFAPGSNVTSTWNDGNYKTISGTSMATPSVAGLVAYLLNIFGPQTTPAQMVGNIKQLATKNALSDIPSGTANLLVYNGFQS